VRSTRGAAITDTVNLYDAKTNLSKLLDRAAAGEEIILAKAGKPKGKWFRISRPGKSAGSGRTCWESPIADDFDGPLPPKPQK
jgi:antitoxin (DNA-binding transcriptional repressor) of toxin-antitoxin stability system